ncbi:RCE2 [Symbiodinium natans]|uniref:RCE2 protein n=1 Tax=Symbiodinium natans TaxID=878477 RepID=A0A812TUP7_9DINO|nr:RCE2 [Symbiodinium natans]
MVDGNIHVTPIKYASDWPRCYKSDLIDDPRPSQAAFAQLFYTIDVAEGPYTPATLTFWVKVFQEYPLPGSISVRCTKRIFHPSIDPRTGATALPGYDAEVGDVTQEVRLASLLASLTQMAVDLEHKL